MKQVVIVVVCFCLLLLLAVTDIEAKEKHHHTSHHSSDHSSHSHHIQVPPEDEGSIYEKAPCVLPDGFVHLSDIDNTIIQEMRYATYHNFVGRPIANYTAPECILTVQAAVALSKVQQYLLSGAADPVSGQTYSLKMYDCYRPTSAVADFVRWAQNLTDTKMKAEFYPEEDKADLFSDGYIAYHSGHSRGSTMDLTIVPLPAAPQPIYVPGQKLVSCHAPYGQRWKDNALDMGAGFDCFSTISWTNDTTIGVQQQFNRMMLVQAMQEIGNFINYDEEYWHFTLINQPYPETEFNFPVC